MSHFTVMVTGPNIADQLQPFHKFECTGIKDQYMNAELSAVNFTRAAANL